MEKNERLDRRATEVCPEALCFFGITKLARLAILVSVLVLSIGGRASQDTDGDGISDVLDDNPNVMSGLVVSLNETDSVLTHVGDISSTYPNLTFTQSEMTGTHGKLKIFSDERFEYVANEAHNALNLNAEKEEIFTFTSDQGTNFHFLIKIIGTNDSAIISKLDYIIDAKLTVGVEVANGEMRVTDRDSNQSSFISQTDTQGDHGKFSINSKGFWTYVSESSFHDLNVGSSVSDSFTIASKDGTQRNVSISIHGSKNPDETVVDGISHHVIPASGSLVLREEILESGPYFTELDGWGRNSATVQKLFKLESGQRYRFRMQGISLTDSRLNIMGPIDEAKSYAVLKQPEKGTVTVNSFTGSWVYTSNDGETEDDTSTIQIGVASGTPVLVPSNTELWRNSEWTKAGTDTTASEYLIRIGTHTINFKASSSGTVSGNGGSSDDLDPDMSFEIVGNLDPGATPTSIYDKSYPSLSIHVASDGTSTTAQVVDAINNEPSEMFFGASANQIKEISDREIKITYERMNKKKAGGVFGRWIAGNDDGDYMGDDAELFITPVTSGYYLLGCLGDAGGNDFGVGTFEIIAEKVAADTFGEDANALFDVESAGDLVRPVSLRKEWEDKTLATGEVDAETVDYDIITNGGVKNFKGKLDKDGDEDWVKINLDIEKWYTFEVGGSVPDPKIDLVNGSGDWVTNGSLDGGQGLNGTAGFNPTTPGVYYLKISSDAPVAWGQGDPFGTGQYVVTVTVGDIGVSGHWLEDRVAPAPYGSLPGTDVPSGTNDSSSLTVTDKVTGNIDIDGDRDWYKYALEKGRIYRFTLNSITLVKPSIRLRSGNGQLLDKDGNLVDDNVNNTKIIVDKGETESTIVFVASYTGEHYIEIFSDENIDPNNADVATGTFNLEGKELSDDVGGRITYTDDGSGLVGVDGSGWPLFIPESYDFSDASYFQAGRRVNGNFYSVNDDDFFGIDLLNRNSYSFSIHANSSYTGTSYATITLYDDKGLLVDDELGYDEGVGFSFDNLTVPADGYYYIKAKSTDDFAEEQKKYFIHSTYFADDFSSNRLTNGTLVTDSVATGNLEANGDEDWIQVDLVAGKRYQFKLDSAPHGAWLKLKGSIEGNPNYLQTLIGGLDSVENGYSKEIGHDIANAHDIGSFGDPGHGSIANMGGLISYGDKDWISVELTEGIIYQAYLIGRPNNNNPAMADPKFSIYDSDGNFIKDGINNAGVSPKHTGIEGKDAEMLFTAPATEKYYFEVSAETTNPKGNVVANGSASNGVTTISVDHLEEYLREGDVLTFRGGATFTLSADSLVTETTLTGVLTGNINDNEIAYSSNVIATQDASNGDQVLTVKELLGKIEKDTVVIFSNGSKFTLSEDAVKDATTLNGSLEGGISGGAAAYIYRTARYALALHPLSTDTVAQHYHGIGSNSGQLIVDWTPRYTAPYFVHVGTHWGGKGEYKISMKELSDLTSTDQVGQTRDTAESLSLNVETVSVLEYGGDRDWYRVEMIPGETYKFDLEADGVTTFSRQSPRIMIFDSYGKLQADTRDDRWPGSQYKEDKLDYSYVWGPGLDPHDYLVHPPEPKVFYVQTSANLAGSITFKVVHVLDDQPEHTHTTGTIEVGGAASGTWEKGLEDGDWFKADLVAGNTYKIDIYTHHHNRPSIKIYTESAVYFRDNIKYPHGDHDKSVFIEVIKDGHAQMTFTSNRTGQFFINAWNTHEWAVEEGGGGNNIYDLSLVHIPDDIVSSIDTSAILNVNNQASATLNTVNDRDWFKISMKKGGVYKFSLIGNSLKDPELRVRDSHGEQLLYNDHRNGWWNPTITYTANDNNVYYIDVGGIDSGTYTIKCDNVYNPPEGTDNFIGAEIELPTDVATVFLNDAQAHSIGNIIQDSIEEQGDRKWYKINLQQARAYEFHQFGDSLQRPSMYIRDKTGTPIFPPAKRDKSRSTGEKLVMTYEPKETGVYYLDAGGFWAEGYQQNGRVAGVAIGSFSIQTFDLGVATERALSWDKSFGDAVVSVVDLAIGAPDISGQLTNADKRDLFRVSLNEGATYRFRISGGLITDDVDRGVKTRLFLHDKDGEYVDSETEGDLDYKAPKTETYYVAVGGTTGQLNGTKFRENGTPFGYKIKLIQKRAAKTEPSVNWFATLNTVANDILTAVVSDSSDKKLDRAELLDILNKVKADGITQEELTDLRILIANYKDLGLSNYLVTILDNLANGDPANQYYTGRKESNMGRTARQDIGNLYPGSSQDRVQMLINKWFLGSDSPAAPKLYVYLDLPLFFPTPNIAKNVEVVGGNNISMGAPGSLTMDLALNAKAGDVFIDDATTAEAKVTSDTAAGTGVAVPVSNVGTVDIIASSRMTLKGARGRDVNQGNLGDCYLLSSLSAVAESNIASIDGAQPSLYSGDMFDDNGDGTFGVRWYDNNGAERWVTVDRYVPGYRSELLEMAQSTTGESWTMLAEKAYVQLNESDNIGQDGTNRYGIGNHFGIAGGSAVMALSHVSGQKSSYKFISDGDSDSGLAEAKLIEMINKKLPMVFSTSAPCPLASHYGVKRKHTYTYESYDMATQKFFLRNPWGNTHAEVTFAGLKHMGSDLAYLDGTRKKMERIDPSQSTFSVSDAASSPGDDGGDSGLTVVDNSGNIKLFKDDQSRLYAGSTGSSSMPVTINGQSMTLTVNGRSVVAAENVSVVNQLLWKDDATNALEPMNFNSSWQFVSSGTSSGVSTSGFHAAEVAFSIDADTDGTVGDPNASDVAPTDLALSANSITENTDTTSAVKVGEITVTDDGLSSVVLTIAGTDAANFEISGNALWVKSGVVLDFETQATYSIDLVATDTVGSYTETVTVTVTVADTTPPVIMLTGDATMSVEEGSSYSDVGASASDNVDGDLTGSIVVTSTVDVNTAGVYTVKYNAIDAAGNAATEVTRTVTVADTTPPVITLTGDATMSVEEGSSYSDVGASATDNVDGDLTSKIVVTGAVDISTAGTYTLKYDVSDAAGNAAESVSRTVVVEKTTVIQTLNLKVGWNLISFYVESDDMTPATVLASIKDNLITIKDLKNSYDPTLPAFINTLKGLNVEDGYWVKVDADVSFELEGEVPAGGAIPVRTGWNLVGYPRGSGEAPKGELTSLGDTVLTFKDLKNSYDPALPAFINTLKVITPGLGYWLKVSEDGVWNVGDVSGEGGNRDISKMGQDESRWGSVVVYPNVSATVLAQVTAEGKAVSSRSAVGVFVGDELRGLQEVVLAGGRSYVAINVNLAEAEKVSFLIWDAGSEREYGVSKTMTLEIGEMYGTAEKFVKLDGVASGSGRTIRIVGYDREPFGFGFESQSGLNYEVEATDDLKEWGVIKTYNGTGIMIRFEDRRDQVFPQIYYRVRVVE